MRLGVTTSMGALLLVSTPAAAQDTSTYVNLTGEVGYATNPFLRLGGDGNGFGRLSAYAAHTRTGERSLTSLSAYVENSTYLEDYGSKQIFNLNARTERQTSEKVGIFGSVGFSGDISGQLSNRFVTVPTAPDVPDQPGPVPVPDTVVDPDLFAFSGRQYRLQGQVGASIRASERGSVTVSAGAQRIFYSDDFLDDYTVFSADAGYNRLLSERSTVGGRLGVWRAEYDGGGDRTTVINPQLTFRRRFSETLDASGAIGLSFAHQKRAGSNDRSTGLSLDGALCRTTEFERLCGRVSRYANSSGAGSLVTTTSAGVDWFKRFDEAQTVQLSASVVRYAGGEVMGVESDALQYRISGSYDRKIGNRASIGLNAGFRSLRLDGPNPGTDTSASVYLRYRVGDIR